jgi:uncharacterized protein
MKTLGARVFLLALLLACMAHAEVAVPQLTARVTDITGTLDAQHIQALTRAWQLLKRRRVRR